MTIDYLVNQPQFLDEVARLSWREWQDIYDQRGQTLEHSRKNYQDRMRIDRLPLTLIAHEDDNLLGMVSLKFHDMDTRPDLDPWLGGLLVLPQSRNRGIGTMLMHRATEEARRLKIPRLYLWTATAESLYRKLGWRVLDRSQYFGLEAVVMELEISALNVPD